MGLCSESELCKVSFGFCDQDSAIFKDKVKCFVRTEVFRKAQQDEAGNRDNKSKRKRKLNGEEISVECLTPIGFSNNK